MVVVGGGRTGGTVHADKYGAGPAGVLTRHDDHRQSVLVGRPLVGRDDNDPVGADVHRDVVEVLLQPTVDGPVLRHILGRGSRWIPGESLASRRPARIGERVVAVVVAGLDRVVSVVTQIRHDDREHGPCGGHPGECAAVLVQPPCSSFGVSHRQREVADAARAVGAAVGCHIGVSSDPAQAERDRGWSRRSHGAHGRPGPGFLVGQGHARTASRDRAREEGGHVRQRGAVGSGETHGIWFFAMSPMGARGQVQRKRRDRTSADGCVSLRRRPAERTLLACGHRERS